MRGTEYITYIMDECAREVAFPDGRLGDLDVGLAVVPNQDKLELGIQRPVLSQVLYLLREARGGACVRRGHSQECMLPTITLSLMTAKSLRYIAVPDVRMPLIWPRLPASSVGVQYSPRVSRSRASIANVALSVASL